MIDNYGNYIRATVHRPGEHHFISVYLVPRLNRLGFLPDFPSWISPDGRKRQWGDVVYGGTGPGDIPRLSIEVKVSHSGNTLGFTVGQYNLQISDSRSVHPEYRGQPDLLLAAVPGGIAVVDWEMFRLRYLDRALRQRGVQPRAVLPNRVEEGSNNAPSFPHDGFDWCPECFVKLPQDPEEWARAEEETVRLIDRACRRVWERTSMTSGSEQLKEGMGQEFLGGGPRLGRETGTGPVLGTGSPKVQAVSSVDDRSARGAQEGGGRSGPEGGVIYSENSIPGGGPEDSGHR